MGSRGLHVENSSGIVSDLLPFGWLNGLFRAGSLSLGFDFSIKLALSSRHPYAHLFQPIPVALMAV